MRKNKFIFVTGICMYLLCACFSVIWASEVQYDSGDRRDPFIPLPGGEETGSESSSSGFNLEGIIYDPPNNSVVLIGGQAYKTGDAVGDGKVIEIFKDHVIIKTDAEQKTIWIRNDEKLQ